MRYTCSLFNGIVFVCHTLIFFGSEILMLFVLSFKDLIYLKKTINIMFSLKEWNHIFIEIVFLKASNIFNNSLFIFTTFYF